MKRLLLYVTFAAAPVFAQWAAPYHQRAITVNNGQVTGTPTNFSMLVLNPTSSLKTVANGGRVTGANGYDNIFVNGSGTLLPFELVGQGGSSTTYVASLSANWINAEYNNQSAPESFYTVGSETANSGDGGSISVAPTALPSGHAGNITLTLTGTGTNWSASTVFTIAGVSNVTKINQNVTSTTAATLVVTTGAGTGSLNVAETVTGTAAGTVPVAAPSFSFDVGRGNLKSVQTLTLTGVNTVWTQDVAAGLFTVSGGAGVSVGTPAITTNTAGSVALTVGTTAGTLTITDTSTGSTATFAAGVPSGCSVVFVQ